MAFTFRGYSYREACPGSPEETISADRASATVIHYWPWDDRANMAAEFIGYSEVAEYRSVPDADPIKYIRRVPAWSLEKWRTGREQGKYYLYCTSVRLSGENGVPQAPNLNNEARFDEARAVLGLETLNHVVMSDEDLLAAQRELGVQSDYPDESHLLRFCEGTYSLRARYQTIPGFNALRLHAVAGKAIRPVSTNTGVVLYEGDLTIRLVGWPASALPKTAIRDCIGKTNMRPFGAQAGPLKNLLGTFATGTLVCLPPEVKQIYLANRTPGVNIQYRFQHIRNYDPLLDGGTELGCNSLYDPATGRFVRISRTGNSYIDPANGMVINDVADQPPLIFMPGDFSALFRPEP